MRAKRYLPYIIVVALMIVTAAAIMIAARWPFYEDGARKSLESVLQQPVQIGKFYMTFFPPGFIAQELETAAGRGPMIRAQELKVESSWLAVFTLSKSLKSIRLRGLAVTMQKGSANPADGRSQSSDEAAILVHSIQVEDSVFEFRGDSPDVFRMQFPSIKVSNFGLEQSSRFEAVIRNSEPPSDIRAEGSLGPWPAEGICDLPASGAFHLRNAEIDKYKGIKGTVASDGTFRGKLSSLEIEGHASAPDFEVARSGHRVGVQVAYTAHVDGLNGETRLDHVDLQLASTRFAASGWAAQKQPEKQGKVTNLDFESNRARIEDLMRMFVTSDPPPLKGDVVFRAHAYLPTQRTPFLKQIQFDADFGVTDAKFSKSGTQTKIDQLSARASGDQKNIESSNDDPGRVISDLKGHVGVRGGTAQFTGLEFRVPGAIARLHGTFELISQRIQLTGTLTTEASLSRETRGVKSFLLKPFDSLFKKKSTGESVLPIHISGVYPNAEYGVDLVKGVTLDHKESH